MQVELLDVASRAVEFLIRLRPIDSNSSTDNTDGPSSEDVEDW